MSTSDKGLSACGPSDCGNFDISKRWAREGGRRGGASMTRRRSGVAARDNVQTGLVRSSRRGVARPRRHWDMNVAALSACAGGTHLVVSRLVVVRERHASAGAAEHGSRVANVGDGEPLGRSNEHDCGRATAPRASLPAQIGVHAEEQLCQRDLSRVGAAETRRRRAQPPRQLDRRPT
eukprot:6212010-Pleurochrysis_carterae.AAC.2